MSLAVRLAEGARDGAVVEVVQELAQDVDVGEGLLGEEPSL